MFSWKTQKEKHVESRDKVEYTGDSNGKQIKAFDTVMLNPITMNRLFVYLENEELETLPTEAHGHKLFTNAVFLDNKKAFVRLSYLNLTGKKFM